MPETEQLWKRQVQRTKDVVIITVIAFVIWIIIGTFGYYYLFNVPLIDAFYNAAIIFSNVDIGVEPETTGQKLFIIFYSLIAAILIISLASNVIGELVDLYQERK